MSLTFMAKNKIPVLPGLASIDCRRCPGAIGPVARAPQRLTLSATRLSFCKQLQWYTCSLYQQEWPVSWVSKDPERIRARQLIQEPSGRLKPYFIVMDGTLHIRSMMTPPSMYAATTS